MEQKNHHQVIVLSFGLNKHISTSSLKFSNKTTSVSPLTIKTSLNIDSFFVSSKF